VARAAVTAPIDSIEDFLEKMTSTITPQLSAIVVNYNAGALLRSCVDSLLHCPMEVEVIVIDNASKDGSLSAVQNLPCVQVISNTQNRGFAAACNQGIEVAKADNLLFLNPDCTFVPGTLAELLLHLRADPKAGMAGGLLVNPDGTEQGGGGVPCPRRGGLLCGRSGYPNFLTAGRSCFLIFICIGSPCRMARLKLKRFPAPACW